MLHHFGIDGDGQSRHERSKLCRVGQLAKLATANDGLCSLRLRRLRCRAVSLWNSVALVTDSHRVLHSRSRNRVTKFVRVPGSGFQCVHEY